VPSLIRYGLSLDQDSLEEKKFPENRRWNLSEVFLVHYNLLRQVGWLIDAWWKSRARSKERF
jgi:hypothetical protein